MSSPYIGEIRLVGFNFAPVNWAFCNGALIPISNNEALFQLIGATYGGDGQSSFGLPNLPGRIPLHQGKDMTGNTYIIGQLAGTETVTLVTSQIPAHTHPVLATSNPATKATPVANNLPALTTQDIYIAPKTVVAMSAATSSAGGSVPHENVMPFQCVNYIICLFGIFPSQN